MSEEKKAEVKTENKDEKKKKKPEAKAAEDFNPNARAKKVAWTMEKCKKAARRFDSEDSWRTGAPASYKSATAHGWIKDCLSVMPKGAGKRSTRVA